ncbi:MAG: ATP-binding protein [Candidatus Pedobacter colombiensis]|uniref:histidine kinase n=1 Tax=Candidatus Pedobacter colombiensis TaxID=3121371 RepID=A0AAJ5W3A8_9SPHI|nr:ATP-binding protein [Pedobacter sp.]WEK17708.1 MAG: ATP-binding protein [Pedobacter sp.]
MNTNFNLSNNQRPTLLLDVKERSDRLMNYFLASFFLVGLILAGYYDTWLIAFGVGGISLLAYYSAKIALPNSSLYQYTLSTVLGIFMAQFIYQMHGLFEMHFFAFIGSTLLITYQKWKLQIPILLVVILHHTIFSYLQNIGFTEIYFSKIDYIDLQTLIIHFLLAGAIFFICGLWAYQLEKYNKLRKQHEVALDKSNQQLRKFNMELGKARKEADQANQAKSIFLATMSHEIRTPMNGVIGMSALLGETSLTEEQRMFNKTIGTCGETLINVINDILDFSKIESGSLELEKEVFDIRQCLEDVLDIFTTKAAQIHLNLTYEIYEDVPLLIIGDHLRLRQVLTNLVGNAMKFTEHGEICVHVHLEKRRSDEQIELRFDIRDTGIGIPEDKLKRLFKAFSQVDSSTTRKYGGTGLGLAISEKLVSLMGGHIYVRSQIGVGSTFSFTISTDLAPLKSTSYTHLQKEETFQNKLSTNFYQKFPHHILIAEDNQMNQLVIVNILRKMGYQPDLVKNGLEAIEAAKQKDYDIILMDIQMPIMDGLEATRIIRRAAGSQPIIIALTANAMADDEEKCLNAGMSDYIRKPFKPEDLMNKLEKWYTFKITKAAASR